MEMLLREWLSMWMEPVSGRVMERRVDARVDFPEPCFLLGVGFYVWLWEWVGRACAFTCAFEGTSPNGVPLIRNRYGYGKISGNSKKEFTRNLSISVARQALRIFLGVFF